MSDMSLTTAEQDMLQLEAARLGIEAEGFLNSALGRYLVDRANQQIDDGMIALVDVAPSDIAANTDIRNQIKVARTFILWLTEAIDSGRLATQNFEETEALEE